VTLTPASATADRRAARALPALSGFVALHVEGRTATPSRRSCAGSLPSRSAVRATALTAYTGVQIPGVLDDLYADAVADDDLGVSFRGCKPTFRVWAPTAQTATLLTWDAGATGDPARREASFDSASGTWSVTGGRR
jgi:hypothetical protein